VINNIRYGGLIKEEMITFIAGKAVFGR